MRGNNPGGEDLEIKMREGGFVGQRRRLRRLKIRFQNLFEALRKCARESSKSALWRLKIKISVFFSKKSPKNTFKCLYFVPTAFFLC